MEIIEKALQEGRKMLTEFESKKVLAQYGIPTAGEALVVTKEELASAAAEIGFPLVLKGSSADLAHKTEKGLIQTDIRNLEEANEAFDRIMAGLDGDDKAVLVQEMVKGKRELVVGMIRDPQFGPSVMFGLGGIFTEILRDVSFRVAPLEKSDALDMMNEIKGRKILDSVRGMEAADRDLLADILVNVGRIGLENDHVKEIDINPIILTGARGVAVDALIVLE